MSPTKLALVASLLAATPGLAQQQAAGPVRGDPLILRSQSEGVCLLAFAPHGELLAAGGYDGTINLWNIQKRQILFVLKHSGTLHSIAFSPDGETLAVATNSGETIDRDEKGVTTAISVTREGTKVTLWDMKSHRVKVGLGLEIFAVGSLDFSPDGRTLATGSYGGPVRLWDMKTGRVRLIIPRVYDYWDCVRFSPDGRMLASANQDDVMLSDPATGKLLMTFGGHNQGVQSVAFTPDSKLLASADRTGEVRVWDLARGKLRTTLRGPQQWETFVAFSPKGKILAAGSRECRLEPPWFLYLMPVDWLYPPGKLRLWRWQTGKELATFTANLKGVTSIAFSPDGRTLATGGVGGTIHLWDVSKDGK